MPTCCIGGSHDDEWQPPFVSGQCRGATPAIAVTAQATFTIRFSNFCISSIHRSDGWQRYIS